MISLELFSSKFESVISIIDEFLQVETVGFVRDHYLKLVRYATHGGKMLRGISTVSVLCELLHIDATDDLAFSGFVVGWAQEILQGAYLIADDIMDGSKTRRGQKCWYLLDGVGESAVNDALMLECFFYLLVNSLADKKILPRIVADDICDVMRYINTYTTQGQSFDTLCKSYNFETYRQIVQNKTSYYTLVAPIVFGMIASQKFGKEIMKDKRLIDFFLRLGFLFQVQDDFIDVYGDPNKTGKIGTDIKDGKVTWFSCMAYQLADDNQKATLVQNYGKNGNEEEVRVKKIFDELGLKEKYFEFQKKEFEYIHTELNNLGENIPKKTIQCLVDSLSNRSF